MRRHLSLLFAVVVVAAAAAATAGEMALTRGGDLYRLEATTDGLLLTETVFAGEPVSELVPQTTGIAASALSVGVDEATGTVVAVWQEGDEASGTIRLALRADGTWVGPITLAGDNGMPAINPELLVARATSEVEDDEGDVVEIGTTFLHLAWWQVESDEDPGTAVYASLPLDEEGLPELDRLDPFPLRDLVPWGIGCHADKSSASTLAHPKLFIDPQTGDPHVLATDFGNCIFLIVQLRAELVSFDAPTKRGRHIIVFGRDAIIGINPAVELTKAEVEVGHDLSVVLYWDAEGEGNTIEYAQMRESGWSEVKRLPLTEALSHERAVALIRSLARR